MEGQLDRQAGHHYDGVQPAGVNSGVQDEVDQQPQEKKSMFRKVKDKAKKLKNSITKHGNGSQDDDEDEDDDETITNGDEMDVDPAVHASSAVVPGAITSDAPARHGLDSEKPTAIGEDPYSIQKTEPTPRSGHIAGRPTTGEPEEINGLPLPVIPEKRVLDPTSVKDEGIKQEGVKFGDLEDLKDAQDPRGDSNYQTKSIDHTGKGQEADVASLVQSFEKTGLHGNSGVHGDSGVPGGVHGDSGGVRDESGIHGESAPKIDELRESFGNIGVHDAPASTGIHDQFAPESFSTDKTANPTGIHDQFPRESFSTDKTANPTGIHDQFPSESFSADKTANPTDSFSKSAADHIKLEHIHDNTTEPKPSDQGSYIGMITSAVPSVITDTAISAKNVVASKLGYGPTKDSEAPRTEEIAGTTKPTSITDKAISAKNAVASKLGYGSTIDADAPRTEEIGATKPVSALETGEVEESAKPASITEKVISAKNAVASKLGYGGTKDAEAPSTEHIAGVTKPVSGLETGEVDGATKPASSPTYVQGMTAQVTGKLSPVYAKVADTGSSVISRVTGAGAGGKEGTTVSGDDKGTSVKEYLYEKFKPGEEEKALSREITDALHIRRENQAKTEDEPRTLGKVTDATGEEPRVLVEAKKDGDNVKAVGPEGVNKGMVEYVKDTVSSWVGKGGGQQQQQQHTQGSSDSHADGIAVPLAGETGNPQNVFEDKKTD